MQIHQQSYAGTLESSDLLVKVSPSDAQTVNIYIESSVEKQFEPQIREVVNKTLRQLGVKAAEVEVNDKGALDCIIKARVQAAVLRAAGVSDNDICWENM